MNIEWDKIRQSERDRVRREARSTVSAALERVADKIQERTGGSCAPLTAGDVTDALREVAREIDKADVPVSRPHRTPVDHYSLGCGDSTCMQAHGVSGRHTGELGGETDAR